MLTWQGFLVLPDQYLRNLAAQSLGRLSKASGAQFTIKEVDELVEQIVSNRDPSARSGCAIALGHIYARLGGMTAGLHLKKILGVLNSLSTDPHPMVHAWAVESISRVASCAGLNFAPYVTGTLGLLAQLYISDSHNDEVGSVVFSNLEVELPTQAIIARCLDSIINVLGPDLQDVSKTRDLILTLMEQFQSEESALVLKESLKCREHLSLYAPGHIDFALYVRLLQTSLESLSYSIRTAALDGLHGIMRRDTADVLRAAGPGLEEKLWLLLDRAPGRDIIKSIMRNWLHQTGISKTSEWVRRCNTVLMKMTMKGSRPGVVAPQKPAGGADLQDEEIAGFNVASASQMDEPGGSSSQELMKWQTRTFAMELLAELLFMVERDAEQHSGSSAELELQSKIGDVIRTAFSASTTGVVGLRIKGLQIINQILRVGAAFVMSS